MNLAFLLAILLSGPVTDNTADQPTVVHLQDAKIFISSGQRIRLFASEGSKAIQLVIDQDGRPGAVCIEAERLRVEHEGKTSEISASGGRMMVKTYEVDSQAPPTQP